MYSAIYRDFRPENFDQLIGQEHIVRVLKNQIENGTVAHAYLFCGTRGTGKTTTARILAKALNCTGEGSKPCCTCKACTDIRDGTYMDVIEIDAASNNGVENIRELRESVNYPPAAGRRKVYIIDEVHMLSTGAFNALLKTLEEPPEYVVFILATTEPQKLPATILSRCLRLDFRRVAERTLVENMRHICAERKIDAEESALYLIASNADGSVRDSLSILEQCVSSGCSGVRREDVAEILGTAGEERLLELTEYIISSDVSGGLLYLDKCLSSGIDTGQFMREWLSHFRNLLLVKYVKNPENILNMSLENAVRVSEQSRKISAETINRGITELTKVISETRWSPQPRVMLEMCIVKLAQAGVKSSETVLEPEVVKKPDPEAVKETVTEVKPDTQAAKETETETKPDTQAAKETETESKPNPEAVKEPEKQDYSRLWKKIREKARKENGVYSRRLVHAELKDVSEHTFTVRASNSGDIELMKRFGSVLESVVSGEIGRDMKLIIEEADDGQEQVGLFSAGGIKELSDFLGVNVELKP